MIAPETLAVAGYALFLLVLAVALDLLARTTHRRSEAYRSAGFRYSSEHDRYVCPEGQHLWLHVIDYEQRVARYRASRHVCNGCAVKHRCTDSDDGREITRALDPWPHSEAGRFHRGIALVPACVALIVLPIEAIRHPALIDLGVLAVPALIGLVAITRVLSDFLASPANFPGARASPRGRRM
jgi:hypothetical protein